MLEKPQMKKWILLFTLSLTFTHSLIRANDFVIGVEYLYWNVLQSNMSYATTVDDLTTFSNPRIIPQHQDWTSGVRVTAGYYFPCGFDKSFTWTRIHNTISGSISDPIIIATELLGTGALLAVGGDGIGGPASSKWNMDLDMFDLNFGCLTFDSWLYAFHPRVGVKGGTIHQKEAILYENFLNTDTLLGLNATVNQKNNLWCVGPKIGVDSAYKLGCGFSIIGDLSAAFLYGKLATAVTTQIIEADVEEVSVLRDTKRHILPHFQLLLGLNWDTCFSKRFPLSIGVGYEVQYFWHTWRITNSNMQNINVSNVGFGDLMFQGLTAKLFFGF